MNERKSKNAPTSKSARRSSRTGEFFGVGSAKTFKKSAASTFALGKASKTSASAETQGAGSSNSKHVSAGMKVRKVGNSLGVILPRELLAALGVEEGDTVDVVQTEDGRIELAAVDRDAADLMELAEEIMAENRTVLRALAK